MNRRDFMKSVAGTVGGLAIASGVQSQAGVYEKEPMFEGMNKIDIKEFKDEPNPGMLRNRKIMQFVNSMISDAASQGYKTKRILLQDYGEQQPEPLSRPSYSVVSCAVRLVTQRGEMPEGIIVLVGSWCPWEKPPKTRPLGYMRYGTNKILEECNFWQWPGGDMPSLIARVKEMNEFYRTQNIDSSREADT